MYPCMLPTSSIGKKLKKEPENSPHRIMAPPDKWGSDPSWVCRSQWSHCSLLGIKYLQMSQRKVQSDQNPPGGGYLCCQGGIDKDKISEQTRSFLEEKRENKAGKVGL